MKKIIPLVASIILILIAGIFASAGTIAQFSDTENAGNPNFKAKILDIRVHSFELPVKFAPGEIQQCFIYVEVPSYSMQPDHLEFRLWADLDTFYNWPGESGGTNGPRLLLRYITIRQFKWHNDKDAGWGEPLKYHWPIESGDGYPCTMEQGYASGEYYFWAATGYEWNHVPPTPGGGAGKLFLELEFDSDAPNKLQGDSIVLYLDVAADQVAEQNQLKCAP